MVCEYIQELFTYRFKSNKEYTIYIKAEDEEGNVVVSSVKTTIRYTTFCKQNGINNLSDCIIATETGKDDISEAKNLTKEKVISDFSKP